MWCGVVWKFWMVGSYCVEENRDQTQMECVGQQETHLEDEWPRTTLPTNKPKLMGRRGN